MAKLGVITDGISRDFEHALGVMSEVGLDYAELQFLWDKEVGDLDQSEIARVKSLVDSHGVTVSCISRHNFAGLSDDSREYAREGGFKRTGNLTGLNENYLVACFEAVAFRGFPFSDGAFFHGKPPHRHGEGANRFGH